MDSPSLEQGLVLVHNSLRFCEKIIYESVYSNRKKTRAGLFLVHKVLIFYIKGIKDLLVCQPDFNRRNIAITR